MIPMLALVRLLMPAVVMCCMYSQPAGADNNADAARNWGLIGTWAVECSEPPSRTNIYLKYLVRSGQLWHDREFGDSSDSNKVIDARIAADGSIEIRVHFAKVEPPQTREWNFVKGPDGRARTMFSRNMKGEYSIK